MSIINLDNLANTPNRQLMYSLITGEIYTIEPDELKNMDQYQIPLIKRPHHSCKVCYGRLHKGYNEVLKVYMPCHKCMHKCVDMSAIKKEDANPETVKND